jgi:predicted metal-dependent peptidase
MNARDIDQLLRFSRAYCCERLPWFAPAVFACKIRQTKAIEVAAISKKFYIYFNPDAVQTIAQNSPKEETLAQLGFIWIHEIAHILREHGNRACELNAEPLLWNIACDIEINDSNWEGLMVPEVFPPIFPQLFYLPEGQLAEFYYRELLKKNILMPWFRDEGSGVHGQNRIWENSTEDEKTFETDELRLEQIRRQVAHNIQNDPNRGIMPAGWLRWANQQIISRTDWRKVLNHRLRTAVAQSIGGRMDYSFNRPNRRQSVYHPVLPPSLNVDWNARIACVVDTSGSMHSHDVAQAIAEVMHILENFRTPVTVIPCDATSYNPIEIKQKADYIKVQRLQGGGGTDMVAGIEAALDLRPAPDAIVVLTDGYTNYPSKPYRTPVVFGIIEQKHSGKPDLPPTPPWPVTSVVHIPFTMQ